MNGTGGTDSGVERLAPGVTLRAARTAQNLSVGEVARQLRLSVAQVEALEAGAFARLPGPVFVRGFIRNYARLLKVNPEPLLQSVVPAPLAESQAPIAIAPRGEPMPVARRRRWPAYAIAAAVFVIVLAAYEYYLQQPTTDATPVAPEATVVPVAPLPTIGQGAAPASTAAAPPEIPVGDRPQEIAAGGVAGASAAALVVDGAVGASPSAAKGEVVMNFDGDSWVEIRDQSGEAIFSRVNHRGTEQRVSGTPPLAVVIGNARGVRLTYNDRSIDLEPHTRHTVARLTLE